MDFTFKFYRVSKVFAIPKARVPIVKFIEPETSIECDICVNNLLAVENPADLAVEALRSLRTSLHFGMMDAKNNILMISGPSPGVARPRARGPEPKAQGPEPGARGPPHRPRGPRLPAPPSLTPPITRAPTPSSPRATGFR